MLTFEQALEKLLAAAQPVAEIRSQPLTAAAGRVLAVAQQSTMAVPPLDNSAMDGYAVRASDCASASFVSNSRAFSSPACLAASTI